MAKPITVYQLNNYIKNMIGSDPMLSDIIVTGQVSGLKFNHTGHIYFDLIDDRAKMRCAIWKSNAGRFRNVIEEGKEIIIYGRIDYYEPSGSCTLIVKELEVAGQGAKALEFERLKAKLQAEGLFDLDHKLPIPAFPKKIALVVSLTGAAIQDMITIMKQRNDFVDIYVFDSRAQGEGAAADIASQIQRVNEEYPDIDCMVIGRGGGAKDELSVYNDEAIARAIYASKIPTISAVGHQEDFFISDFVADMRAATPTDAANIAVPDISEIKEKLDQSLSLLKNNLHKSVEIAERRLEAANIENMKNMLLMRIENAMFKADSLKQKLEAYNPYDIIDRGYAIVTDENGNLVSSVENVDPGAGISIMTKDGNILATVDEIRRKS